MNTTTETWLPVSSDQGTAGPDDRFPASLIKLPAASSFDGRDHVLSAAALWLHLRAAGASVAGDHPGLVPGEYLRSLTGKDLYRPGDDPAALAAELCTAGLWERADGGYRILDVPAIQEFIGKEHELRDKGNRAAAAATGMPPVRGADRVGCRGELPVRGMRRDGRGGEGRPGGNHRRHGTAPRS